MQNTPMQPNAQLGDFISVLTDYHANGAYKKLKENVELLDEPNYAVMIRTTNFEKEDFKDDLKYISKDAYEFLKKSKVKPGDILMNKIAKPGSVYLMPDLKKPISLAMNLFLIRVNQEEINQTYIYYWLKANEAYVKSFANGAATQTITKQAVKELKINVLPRKYQDTVVKILDTYQNLIENNNRRIAILEDMAQSLYQEWFVRFRFPGHQNTKLKESSLGLIPERWEVKAASDVIDIAPKMSLPKAGEKPFVSMPNVSTASMVIDEIEMREGNSGTKFINGDTLLARITPCLQNGKTGFVQFLDELNPIGFGSTEFIVMRSKGLTPEFIYCLARSNSFRGNAINSMAGADGRQRVKNECFNSYYLPVPPNEILDQFSEISVPAFKEIFTLNKKNKNLKKQRDMLLPKLISGHIAL